MEDHRREELARFLRNRRERIDPREVGLPSGPRRRTAGLRREEVAVLAGVSPTWYTYLEQGRNIQPSPEVLDSLARVLRLTEDERRYVHVLAYGHQPSVSVTAPAPPVPDTVRQVVEVFGNVPYPIYVVDEIVDLIAWNAAFTTWYGDFTEMPHRRNMLWWYLTNPDARGRLVNWEDDCRDIVARYRAFVATRPENPLVRQTIEELREASEEFALWWVGHEVRGQRFRPRIFRHPEYGVRAMLLQVVTPTEADTVRIVFHLPAPSAAAQ